MDTESMEHGVFLYKISLLSCISMAFSSEVVVPDFFMSFFFRAQTPATVVP
jgi:hypothetical protein